MLIISGAVPRDQNPLRRRIRLERLLRLLSQKYEVPFEKDEGDRDNCRKKIFLKFFFCRTVSPIENVFFFFARLSRVLEKS